MSDDLEKNDPDDTRRQDTGDPLGIIGWVIGNKYRIRSYIGGGGFGEVYEGFNINLPDQRLVIKFFKRVQSRDKFVKEAKILCLLDHPNILRIIDFLPDEGAILVPYIDGEDGAKILKKSGPLKEELYLKVARSMTSALAYAHERKIAHRDIKPGNILIDKSENVYLIDFGIAKEIKDSATKTAYVALTPMFAAPERQSGEQDYNPFLSDIYELGVTLFNFATNVMPYRTPSNPNLQEWGGQEVKKLSPQLKKMLKKATHPDPAERYQSAAQFAEDAARLETIYARRGKTLLIKIAVALLALMVVAFTMKQFSARRAAKEDETKIADVQREQVAVKPPADTIAQIIQKVESDMAKPIGEAPGEAKPPAAEVKKDTIKPGVIPQTPSLPTLLVHIKPAYNASLFIDGVAKSADRKMPIDSGNHEIKIIHPDYPILIDTVDVLVDRNLEYDLASRYADSKQVTFSIAINPPDLNSAILTTTFNGKKRKYKNDELPILDLKMPVGKWQYRFDIVSASGSPHKIDSLVTFPYGGGPQLRIIGNSAATDFGSSEWRGIDNIVMVIYWKK
jgi:serine/threonine protein kinase